jgi:hypothetical protein
MENGLELNDGGNAEILLEDLRDLVKSFDELVVFDAEKGIYNLGSRVKGNLIFHSVYWNFAELRNDLGRFNLENEVEISTRLFEVIKLMQKIFKGCQTKEELKAELDNLIQLFEELEQFEA